MPYGFAKSGPPGQEVGVMAAAAIIFFAFYGFDAIATAAEESKNPERDLAIGIVGSMILCVIIYMAVAAAAIGAEPYQRFAASPEPLALILRDIGQPLAAKILALSASIGLPTVILAFFYGQSRIFLSMSRDGLLPAPLAKLSGRRTPVRITLFTAMIVGILAGLVPLNDLVALANAGTLDRLHRGVRGDAGDAQAGAGHQAAVPHPAAVGHRDDRHPRLRLFVLQPAEPHPAMVRDVERGRAGDLFRLRGGQCRAFAPRRSCLRPRPPGPADCRSRRLVAVLLIPAALGSSATIFNDGDVSWHIATGQWILDHRAIPHTDPFSFTWAGKPWVPIEWLAEVMLAGAYRLAGYGGVAALVTAALIALHGAVYINARRWLRMALLPLVAMDFVLIPMMLARPHVLAWPLIAWWTWLMLRAREHDRAPPLAAALLMVVWANLHGSFVMGLAIAGAFGLEALVASSDRARALRNGGCSGWLARRGIR